MTGEKPKPRYGEGTWFAVPLNPGGYAAGVLARRGKKYRSVLFGYFFGPRHSSPPSLDDTRALKPGDAVWIRQFGHLGLRDGEWPIIGKDPNWDPAAWPLPDFRHRDRILGHYLRVEYDQSDVSLTLRKSKATEEEVADLPEDGLSGAVAVVNVLSKLIA